MKVKELEKLLDANINKKIKESYEGEVINTKPGKKEEFKVKKNRMEQGEAFPSETSKLENRGGDPVCPPQDNVSPFQSLVLALRWLVLPLCWLLLVYVQVLERIVMSASFIDN